MPKAYQPKTDRKNGHHKNVAPPVVFRPGFFGNIDRRTELGRALREFRSQVIADLGGEAELSRIQTVLIDKFVWLSVRLETWEHEQAGGNDESIGRYTQMVNALSGLATKLGLNRKATATPWLSMPPASSTPTNSDHASLPPEKHLADAAGGVDDK